VHFSLLGTNIFFSILFFDILNLRSLLSSFHSLGKLQGFGGTYCLHLQGGRLRPEVLSKLW
jgi:hypothetical protein